MTGAKLQVSQIAKRFQGILAVDSISFVAEAGKVTGLIGPNGSGKTTTMNMVTGLYPTDSGQITLDETLITGLEPDRIASLGVARTFQNIRLLAKETVLTNVMLGTYRSHRSSIVSVLAHLPRVAAEERAFERCCRDLLDQLQIGHLAGAAAGDLSYGDRRRVEIARALAGQPRLLLLDEPAAGMNHQEKRKLGDIVQQIRDSGVTILLIEHDIDLVSRLSDHIVVLNFGREIAEGTPEAVRTNAAVIEAYLGRDDDA